MTPASTPAVSTRRAAELRLAERRLAPRSPADLPLIWVIVAVAIGAALAPAAAMGLRPEWLVLLTLGLLTTWVAIRRRANDSFSATWLLGTVAFLAAAWSGASWRLFNDDDIGRFARLEAEPVCLEVVATAPPTHYPAEAPSPFRAIPSTDRTVVTAQVVKVRNAADWREASGNCEVTIAGDAADIEPGDRLRVFGQLSRPRPAMNPGEPDNAIAERAERRLARVWTESPECVTTIDTGEASLFSQSINSLRQAAIDTFNRRLTPKAAPLVRAMLLGDPSGLTTEDFDAYRYTGTVHLLVVSGFHVGLVAIAPFLLLLGGLLSKRTASLFGIALVVVYVAIVGGQASALRAGIVAIAACIAALAGRRPISVNTLAGAAIVVFALSPGAWVSPGTRLSFLATATLLGIAAYLTKQRAAVVPPLERLIRSSRSPWKRKARSFGWGLTWALAASILVQITTGPLVASEYHLVSLAAAPLSLVLTPLVYLQVISGVGTLICEAFGFEWLTSPFAWLASVSSEWLDGAVKYAATFDWASIWTAGPAPWWVLAWTIWLAIAAAMAMFWPTHGWVTTRLGLALLAAAFVPTLWGFATAGDELRCSFIAVGHGSSTLIETPDGRVILVDAGALTAPDHVTDVIARTLWARGLHRIDMLVLTHADTDHYNAVPGLLERFSIGSIVTTTLMFPTWIDPADHSGPAELARLLHAAGVPVQTVEMGDRWRVGDADLLVLHPDDIGVAGSDNANSLVLGVEYADRRVLLPGDLESPGTEWLMGQEPYDVDLLLAPHHGSERSDPVGFSAWCLPEQVVVSSGEPRQVTQNSFTAIGAAVWETHEQGFVTSAIGASGVHVAAWRPTASVEKHSERSK